MNKQLPVNHANYFNHSKGVYNFQQLFKLKMMKKERQRQHLILHIHQNDPQNVSHEDKQNRNILKLSQKIALKENLSKLSMPNLKMNESYFNKSCLLQSTSQSDCPRLTDRYEKENEQLSKRFKSQRKKKNIDIFRKVRLMHKEFQKQRSIIILNRKSQKKSRSLTLSQRIICNNINPMSSSNLLKNIQTNRQDNRRNDQRSNNFNHARYKDIPLAQFIYENGEKSRSYILSPTCQNKLQKIFRSKNSIDKQKLKVIISE